MTGPMRKAPSERAAKALEILRRSPKAWFDSGALAQRMGITRASINKILHKAEAAGLGVEHRETGAGDTDARPKSLEWRAKG